MLANFADGETEDKMFMFDEFLDNFQNQVRTLLDTCVDFWGEW